MSCITGSISTASMRIHIEAQCMGDVVARAGADNQHVLKRRAATVLLQQMN